MHEVYRLFFQSSERVPPPPHPQASVAPTPFGVKGERHTRLRGRGYPNSDEETDTLVLYVHVYYNPSTFEYVFVCYVDHLKILNPAAKLTRARSVAIIKSPNHLVRQSLLRIE
jgi:hypothetical protein